MKKILIGVVITLIVLVGGCAAITGGLASSASKTINKMEDEKKSKNELYSEMLKNVKWEVQKDQFTAKIVGVFENTSDENISYIQFNYKTLDKDGVVVDKAFTNETDIKPGEKRQVKISLLNKEFEKYEIEVSSSAI